MYTVDCAIEGIAPLMQHRFPIPELETMSKGGHKSTGSKDYTQEWRDYFWVFGFSGVFHRPCTCVKVRILWCAKGD
jgi:hypothetical protein